MCRPLSCLLAFFLAVALGGCGGGGKDEYAEALLRARAAKDEMLRAGGDSPLPADRRAAELPLPYFAPDPAYRVPATLTPDAGAKVVQMLTSTGQLRPTRVMGTLEFTLKGQVLKLRAFAEEGSNGARLFVPFTDATTGQETYGAGRYLDLDRTSTGIYVIDFNTAYNPYCAYNPTYDCPVPPKENRLAIAIRAGEKIRRGH
jgi:uncharacterized protein (DUF1684 family)